MVHCHAHHLIAWFRRLFVGVVKTRLCLCPHMEAKGRIEILDLCKLQRLSISISLVASRAESLGIFSIIQGSPLPLPAGSTEIFTTSKILCLVPKSSALLIRFHLGNHIPFCSPRW